MALQISDYRGFRSIGVIQKRPTQSFAPSTSSPRSRRGLVVENFKRTPKKKKVVLLENVKNVGDKGEVITVAMGYWRNYLQPFRKADVATQEILDEIQAKKDAEIKAKQEDKDKASRFATALRTIGKFTIVKKSGEKNMIFGSVTTQEIAQSIYQQTGQKVEKKQIKVPEIKTLGTYDVTVALHPEVTGAFKIVVVKERTIPGKK